MQVVVTRLGLEFFESCADKLPAEQPSRPEAARLLNLDMHRIYIFTVRGSESLKLRADSAGRTISLLPV